MAEDFSRHISRVVASQIAESTGFDACQDSAVEILGDLLLRYLATVCSGSHSYAELAGRSQSNLSDVLLALEDLGVTPEDLNQHMQLQGTDVPFAHTLAQYPVHRQRPLPTTFAEQKDQPPPPSHIPTFLPAFPDPHTYQHTPAYTGHQTDPHKQRQSMLEAKQKSEAALHKLHQRISSKVSSQPDSNPFLAAPAVEQLQMPAATLAAAAAAAAAGDTGLGGAAAAAAAGDGVAGPSSSAAAAAAGQAQRANGLLSSSLQPPTAAAGSNGSLGKIAIAASSSGGWQPPALAAMAAGGGDAAEEQEDALFEGAAVLKAFSSILPPELLEQHAERLQGLSSEEAAARRQQRRQQAAATAAAAAGNGVDEHDVIIEEEGGDGMDIDGADAAAVPAAADPAQMWLAWDPQQDLQQQQQRPGDLLGPAGAAGPELLRFGIDPLAAGKGTAVRLAGRARPPDAFAERGAGSGQPGGVSGYGGVGSSSGRQRKSKYDADPKQQKAEGILSVGPEAVFATTAEGRQGAKYAEYQTLDDEM